MKDVLVMVAISRIKNDKRNYEVQNVVQNLKITTAKEITRAFDGATPRHKLVIVPTKKFKIGDIVTF